MVKQILIFHGEEEWGRLASPPNKKNLPDNLSLKMKPQTLLDPQNDFAGS